MSLKAYLIFAQARIFCLWKYFGEAFLRWTIFCLFLSGICVQLDFWILSFFGSWDFLDYPLFQGEKLHKPQPFTRSVPYKSNVTYRNELFLCKRQNTTIVY